MHPALLAALMLVAADAPPPVAIEVTVPARTTPVSYVNEIADILDAKCVGCHSTALTESKLILEEVPGMLKGGKHGPAIVPGKAEESLLFNMAAHRAQPVMPPRDKKGTTPLTSDELGLLKLWIDAGARDDSSEESRAAKPIELGALPPGVQPIVAVDMTADGERVAAGRANVVQVYDVSSGLMITSLGGHKDIIQSIRFSPDGKRLAAGSYQVVTLWNVPTGGLAKTLTGHTDQVKALGVSADRKTAYSAGLDKSIRAWNLTDGKPTAPMSAPCPVLSLAVSPDGQTLALGGQDSQVHVMSAVDGRRLLTLKGHAGPVNGVAFTPDGTRLVSVSSDATVRIWTLPGQDELKSSKTPEDVKVAEPTVLSGHKGPVDAVAITPDGRLIVTGGDDGTVRLWHAADGKASRVIEGHSGPVLALAVSAAGDMLLTGSADKNARLFELASGTLRQTLSGHNGAVQGVAFSPSGNRLVTAGADGGLKLWDTATGNGVIAFGHAAPSGPIQPLNDVAFTGDGTLLSASADKTLKTWTFEGSWSEMKPLGPHVFRVLAIDFSPDGKQLAAGGGEPSRSGEIKIWDVNTAQLIRSLEGVHTDTVFGLRYSPDGTKLASGAADKFLKVTNLADGKELKTFEGHTHHVLAVDWKSDGKELASGGADNVLKVWDFETGEQMQTLDPVGKQVTAVRWVPAKTQIAGASGDKLVRFWNVPSATPGNTTGGQRRRSRGGATILRTFSGPSDYVFGVAVSKDGSRVAAGGADSVLFIWNGQDGQVIRKIEPPAHPAAPSLAKP